jgi:plastocyanin
MRWLLAVLAIALVAVGTGAFISTQGTSGAQMGTPDGTPCPSPMAGTPTAMASPTMAASPSASPEACPSEGEFRIDMVDIAFEPNTLTIPADTDVTISLPNTGALPHNFSIDELGISVDVAAGDTGTATINAPAGTYEFYCNVPGHKEAGMVGTLTVQ